jgi:NADH dehydrogenase
MDADAHALDYLAIAHWHHFRFRQGAFAVSTARVAKSARCRRGPEGEEILPPRTLPTTRLILCLGSVSNDFGVPGASTHPISLDTLRDAERFHRRLLALCVRADGRAAAGGKARSNRHHRGGATGVELAAEIRQTTRAHAAYGPRQHRPARDICITLLEAFTRILPPLVRARRDAADELLKKLDVARAHRQRVTEIDADGVHTAGGDFYRPISSCGPRASWRPRYRRELDGLETNRGNQLVVGPTLQTTRDPDIFAFGDCAAAPWMGHKEGAILPPRAQVAHQQATLLGKSIKAASPASRCRFPLPRLRLARVARRIVRGGHAHGRPDRRQPADPGPHRALMYTSLYKMHQVSIHGLVRVAFDTVGA